MTLAGDDEMRARARANDWLMGRLQPLGGKVLIERDVPPDRLRPDSLIILPEMSRGEAEKAGRWATGKIVSMGPGMKVGVSKKWKGGDDYRWPMPDIQLGARVVYRTWAVRAEFVRGDKNYDLVSDEVIDIVIEANADELLTIANLRPLFDRALVKRSTAPTKTAGGILIPDGAKEKPVSGEVLRVGRGRIESSGLIRALDYAVGDRVWFGEFSGTSVSVSGVECLILREEDILGIAQTASR